MAEDNSDPPCNDSSPSKTLFDVVSNTIVDDDDTDVGDVRSSAASTHGIATVQHIPVYLTHPRTSSEEPKRVIGKIADS